MLALSGESAVRVIVWRLNPVGALRSDFSKTTELYVEARFVGIHDSVFVGSSQGANVAASSATNVSIRHFKIA